MFGSVVAAVAVILSGRELLIAHRVKRLVGHDPECWSASFEEQFSPVTSTWGGSEHPADIKIEDTIIRGLREEFVSPIFAKEVVVSIQAVFLNLVNLNLEVLAVAELPDTSFSDLVEHWDSTETPDRGEHDALATIPLNESALKGALRSPCPGKFAENPAGNRNYAEVSEHVWNPGSQARLACCQWLLEIGRLNGQPPGQG